MMNNKNTKQNNNILKILMLTVILIASIAVTLTVYALNGDLESQERVNIKDLVGKVIATYSAYGDYVLDRTEFESYFDDYAFNALSQNPAIYCLAHGKDLFNQHASKKGCNMPIDHPKGNKHMDALISFEYGGDPIPDEFDFDDYMDASDSGDRITKSNIRYKVEAVSSLRNIQTNYRTFTGNIIPYAATFEIPHWDPYHNPRQYAIWGAGGSVGAEYNNNLYIAGYSVDALEEEIKSHGENPTVTPIRNEKDSNMGCGTIYKDGKYIIGPFQMSDYAYVGSKFVEPYSGKDVKEQKDLVGGIASGIVTLNNGTELKFGTDVKIRYLNPGDNNRSHSGSANSYWVDENGTKLNITIDENQQTLLNGTEVVSIVTDGNGFKLVREDGSSFTIKVDQSSETVEWWGVPKNYTCPFPNSTFYLEIDRAKCGNATTLSSFTFQYRKTRADGTGFVAKGEFIKTTFKRTETDTIGCRTYSTDTCYHGDGGHSIPDRTYPQKGGTYSYTHKYCSGHACNNDCYCSGGSTCSHGYYSSHTVPPDEPGGTSTSCSGGSKCSHGYYSGHSYSCGGTHYGTRCNYDCATCTKNHTWECIHDHIDCRDFDWHGNATVEIPQPLLGVASTKVEVTEDEKKSTVDVRLTTDLQINKFITKAEHIGENITIFGENTDRSRVSRANPSRTGKSSNTSAWKESNPVKVERGDKITYKIDVVNNQDQKVSYQLRDVLPDKCADYKFDPTINGWLEIDGNSIFTVTVTLRTIADSGIYENFAEIYTKNEGKTGNSADYNRTDYVASDPRHNGPVVNVAELEGGIIEDSDFYQIKEFNVNIDKYIQDVNHEPKHVGTSNLDTTIKSTDERSVEHGMTENGKKASPVYVEFGDTIIYKIKVYNTTSKYDGTINRNDSPYWNPDKVYVNIEDTLPKKYSDLKVEVDNGSGAIDTTSSKSKFTINNMMVPADGVTTVTVTLKVEEFEKGTVETNSVKFIGEIRNINKGTGNGNDVDDKYCVIKNNPKKTETKDFYKLNDYDAYIDKYLYTYDESIRKDNITLKLSNEESLVETKDGVSNVLKSFRANANLAARERLTDAEKQAAPVPVEKDEMISYRIKVTNEAKDVAGGIPTGKKPATQVRTDKVTDLMQLGLQFVDVEAKQYNADGTICSRYNVGGNVPVTVSDKGVVTANGRTYTKYEYDITPDTILNPGEFIIYTVKVKVTESDLFLGDLDNSADLSILSNINHKASTEDREIKNPTRNENISKQQTSHEYVRMKDLIIGGKVWLDFNKNGLMDDTVADYVAQAKDPMDEGKVSTYYNINKDAMMKDIIVKLYKADGTLVRTTKTDSEGIFSFARAEDGITYYATQYYNLDPAKKYNASTIYERVDKATGKDGNGNYTSGSQYITYYIEYEYDGVVYKSTAYSGKDHLNNDGSYKGAECNHPFETNTGKYATDDYAQEASPSEDKLYKYEFDSNANEFVAEREKFNTNYEYITYNQAYSVNNTTEPGSKLDFEKTDHTSHLLVDHARKMTARSFIEQLTQPGVQEATNYIPLFGYDASNVTVPYSRYLKFINLGLELREDVDILLTKDVYKVTTTIKGEEMEYNFNSNFRINGDVLDETAVNNYKFDNPYGIEIYESDYKFRNEQYSSIKAVQDYLSERAELNLEVTYRIRVDNNKTHKDGDLKDPGSLTNGYDNKNFEDTDKTNLYVKVDEILDLYDENFMEYTPEMEAGSKDDYILAREMNPFTGRFAYQDKKIKIAEAWYYKPSDNGNYVLDDTTKIYVDTTKENIAVPDGAQRYDRVELKVSNNAIKGSTNEYINSEKYKTYDGYHKLYISGMGEEKIEEGSHLDVFVKYVLNKAEEEITVTNENFEETVTKASSELYSAATVDGDGNISWNWSSSSTETTTTEKVTNMVRSLIIKEHTTTPEKQAYGLATENIAQVNLYSVWYAESDKPASLVDKDSNVGNVGINNDKQVDSADNKKIYEDTIYKTGINISALGTANIPGQITETIIKPENGSGKKDIRRFLNGHVWDDSRTDNAGDPTQFIGNGLRAFDSDKAIEEAKKNELVPIVKSDPKLTEEKDIPVSSAKAEFIEIVETDVNKYYELVPTDVSCDYKQHVRTDEEGAYELYGYTPGKYVVRFTYGDNIKESGMLEQTTNGTQANQEDMYLFNGQDYKSTQYTMPDPENGGVLSDNVVFYNDANKTEAKDIVDTNNKKIDKVIAALEEKDFNDARDDEIKRLETNSYSEIMDNMVAEILQGMANGKEISKDKYLTNNKDENTPEELKALVDNTWMFAETIPFTVRAEKISDDLKALVKPIVNDPTYANREQLESQLSNIRDFKIENVDFGIEYRPENSVQLEKEIKEVKITTESGDTIVDLHFFTKYNEEGKETVKTHYLDTEKSVGLDMIQFISNEYESSDLISNLITEKKDAFQGFVYINYDVDIQQGATVEITYEFIAENHGEVDRIAKNLDDIRYQNNFASKGISGSIINNSVTGNENTNGITNYRANLTAANDMINNLYVFDADSNAYYRTSPKVLTATDGSRTPGEVSNPNGASRNRLSYYGYYSGYEYYTGEVTDFDTVAELKFNKILDYVDKDMLYLNNTKGDETLNRTWSILDNTYKEYYSTIDWARSDQQYIAKVSKDAYTLEDIGNYVNSKIEDLDIKSAYEVIKKVDKKDNSDTASKPEVGGIAGASIDPDGYIYNNMLLSTDTGMYTDIYVDADRNFAVETDVPDGTNPSIARFLVPMVADSSDNDYSESRGKIELTISKAISAETNDDELEYENIAEIVEFTTLTGRRTNFAITIGNVDVRMDKNKPKDPDEYPQAVPEADQAAAEVITLVPPQGLMKRDRVIKDVVEIAKTGTSIIGIVAAVAGVVIFVTMFAIRKYRKRRIK